MKNENLLKGSQGESLAMEALLQKGYQLLERNYRVGHLEVDLIMEDANYIVFVEVKSRKSALFGEPESFVTLQKQRNIIRAANLYVLKNNIAKEVRFDIVSVIIDQGIESVKHIPNSFTPRW